MFFKKIKPKTFVYQPRFYKPELDNEERKKRKLNFKKYQTSKKRKGSIIYFAIIFIIILYLFIRFGGFR